MGPSLTTQRQTTKHSHMDTCQLSTSARGRKVVACTQQGRMQGKGLRLRTQGHSRQGTHPMRLPCAPHKSLATCPASALHGRTRRLMLHSH